MKALSILAAIMIISSSGPVFVDGEFQGWGFTAFKLITALIAWAGLASAFDLD
jgi:hypothetical protein